MTTYERDLLETLVRADIDSWQSVQEHNHTSGAWAATARKARFVAIRGAAKHLDIRVPSEMPGGPQELTPPKRIELDRPKRRVRMQLRPREPGRSCER